MSHVTSLKSAAFRVMCETFTRGQPAAHYYMDDPSQACASTLFRVGLHAENSTRGIMRVRNFSALENASPCTFMDEKSDAHMHLARLMIIASTRRSPFVMDMINMYLRALGQGCLHIHETTRDRQQEYARIDAEYPIHAQQHSCESMLQCLKMVATRTLPERAHCFGGAPYVKLHLHPKRLDQFLYVCAHPGWQTMQQRGGGPEIVRQVATLHTALGAFEDMETLFFRKMVERWVRVQHNTHVRTYLNRCHCTKVTEAAQMDGPWHACPSIVKMLRWPRTLYQIQHRITARRVFEVEPMDSDTARRVYVRLQGRYMDFHLDETLVAQYLHRDVLQLFSVEQLQSEVMRRSSKQKALPMEEMVMLPSPPLVQPRTCANKSKHGLKGMEKRVNLRPQAHHVDVHVDEILRAQYLYRDMMSLFSIGQLHSAIRRRRLERTKRAAPETCMHKSKKQKQNQNQNHKHTHSCKRAIYE